MVQAVESLPSASGKGAGGKIRAGGAIFGTCHPEIARLRGALSGHAAKQAAPAILMK